MSSRDHNHFRLPEDACAIYRMVYEKLKVLVADMYMLVPTENNVLLNDLCRKGNNDVQNQ